MWLRSGSAVKRKNISVGECSVPGGKVPAGWADIFPDGVEESVDDTSVPHQELVALPSIMEEGVQ